MTWESGESTRCTATLGDGVRVGVGNGEHWYDGPRLTCSLAYDHPNGHVYVTGSWVPDRHGKDEDNG